MFVIGFPIFSYPIRPHTTTTIGCSKPYTKPSQSYLLSRCIQIIMTYRSNTVPIKKAGSLRATSLSQLDNTVNNNSIVNTKYAEFSTKWQVLIHFHNSACAYNHPCIRHQKFVPLLQLMFNSLFYSYFFRRSSLQSPLTLSSSITQQFFTSLFLRTIMPTIFTKTVFSTSNIQPIQAADLTVFNHSLVPQNMDNHNRGLTITDYISLTISVFQAVVSNEDACNRTVNHSIHLLTYTQRLVITLNRVFKLIFILSSAFSYTVHSPL